MLWDRGYWEPEGNRTPQEALEKGDLKFTLEGDRLRGSFVLVRMRHDRNGGNRINWLLIKHEDEFSVAENGEGSSRSTLSRWHPDERWRLSRLVQAENQSHL